MHAQLLNGMLLALDKHQEAGVAGFIIGALIAIWGIFRVMRRTAGAMMFTFFGLIVIVIGVLLYTRKI